MSLDGILKVCLLGYYFQCLVSTFYFTFVESPLVLRFTPMIKLLKTYYANGNEK
jgi:hypothetical protein